MWVNKIKKDIQLLQVLTFLFTLVSRVSKYKNMFCVYATLEYKTFNI